MAVYITTNEVPLGFRAFKCHGCGYTFIIKLVSPVCRCKKCERPLIAIGYKEKDLDAYARMKLEWLRHPGAWAENIRNRSIENKPGGNKIVKLKDNKGRNLGLMPKAQPI